METFKFTAIKISKWKGLLAKLQRDQHRPKDSEHFQDPLLKSPIFLGHLELATSAFTGRWGQ